jgi:hypothetical protein
MYALEELRGGDTSQIKGVLAEFDRSGGLIGLAKDTFSQQMKIIKGIGLQGLLSPLHKKILEAFGTAVGVETDGRIPNSPGYPTGPAKIGPYTYTEEQLKLMGDYGKNDPEMARLRAIFEESNRHTGGYIKKYHDGGIIGSYKALVKDNEAMFLGNIGASVVPEQNINIMTNDKLSSLIEGVKSNILSSAVGQVVTSKQSNQTDVNINISGNVFALNDFKKIIRDTVLEVIGGR